MTEEQKAKRAEYQRQWARAHPERLRVYRKNLLRRRALADLVKERTAAAGHNKTETDTKP